MGDRYASALDMLLLTLPGTTTTDYGEELGTQAIEVPFEDTQHPFTKNMGSVSNVRGSSMRLWTASSNRDSCHWWYCRLLGQEQQISIMKILGFQWD